VSGENLSGRPPATDVPEAERGLTVIGRWVPAYALQIGDVVLLASGQTTQLESVSNSSESRAVYNLAVGGPSTFAVGIDGLLVHNAPACTPEMFEQIKNVWKQMLGVTKEGEIWKIAGKRAYNGSTAFQNGGFIKIVLDSGEQITVPFKRGGFADFSQWLFQGGKNRVEIVLSGDSAAHIRAANKAANYATTPDNHTWHHLEELGTMILVRTDVHRAVSHTGISPISSSDRRHFLLLGRPRG